MNVEVCVCVVAVFIRSTEIGRLVFNYIHVVIEFQNNVVQGHA